MFIENFEDQFRIRWVTLRSRWIEALTIMIEGVGVNREQHQVLVLAEHEDQGSSTLLECYRNVAVWEAYGQAREEPLNGFWRMFQLASLEACLTVYTYRPCVLSICPVDAKPGGEIIIGVICYACPFDLQVSLLLRRPYRRV